MKDEIKIILYRLTDSVTNPVIEVLYVDGVSESIGNIQCLEPSECKILLDYITNLRTIEQQYSAILSENAELKNKISDLEDTLIDKKEYRYGLETQLTKLQKDLDYQKQAEQEYNKKHTILMKKYKESQIENKKDREYIKELKGSLRNYHIKNNKLIIENVRLKDCESRNEKAIYYIWKEIEQEYDEENNKWLKEKIDNLLNILQGGDKDVKD